MGPKSMACGDFPQFDFGAFNFKLEICLEMGTVYGEALQTFLKILPDTRGKEIQRKNEKMWLV